MKRILITRDSLAQLTKDIQVSTVSAQLGSIKLNLDKNVMVPHPSDLRMIEIALEFITKNKFSIIADIGTGSGILAIGIALENPSLNLYASDINEQIISIAQKKC